MSKPYSKSQLRNAKGGQTSVVYVVERKGRASFGRTAVTTKRRTAAKNAKGVASMS